MILSDHSCDDENGNETSFSFVYRGKCYEFSSLTKSWDEAKLTCTNLGGYLVEILDTSTQDFLAEQARDLDAMFEEQYSWWIGGWEDVSDDDSAWFWVDGKKELAPFRPLGAGGAAAPATPPAGSGE